MRKCLGFILNLKMGEEESLFIPKHFQVPLLYIFNEAFDNYSDKIWAELLPNGSDLSSSCPRCSLEIHIFYSLHDVVSYYGLIFHAHILQ